jgi:hypothetical protein
MRNSSRGVFGRRSGGTVTVIEESVHRSSVRKAKIIFWVVWVCTGVLTATVAASKWHPIVALLIGAGIGLAAAVITAGFVIIWPVVRVIWWWTAEIGLALALVTGWTELAATPTSSSASRPWPSSSACQRQPAPSGAASSPCSGAW